MNTIVKCLIPSGMCLWLFAGCGYESTRPTNTAANNAAGSSGQAQFRNDLLSNALLVLNSPEKFDNEAVANGQVIDRLNQWRRLVRQATTEGTYSEKIDWQRDPLLDTLPANLQSGTWWEQLDADVFDKQYDGQFLREAVSLRDAARSVKSEKADDLSLATALFAWIVANIQLEYEPPERPTAADMWQSLHLPLETLLNGRGTAAQRAWLFVLMARQLGLDAVILATPDTKDPAKLRPWTVALVDGDDLYLFDPTYGLPIPGPKGEGVSTLAQVAADDSLLRQLDVPDRPYPKNSADLANVTALLEASPGYLSRRMKVLEMRLSGNDRMAITTQPTALAEKLKKLKHIGEVRLWTQPFEVLAARGRINESVAAAANAEQMPFVIPSQREQLRRSDNLEVDQKEERPFLPLRLGRLMQLRGEYGGKSAAATSKSTGNENDQRSEILDRGAKFYYLRAIPTEEQIAELKQMEASGREIAPGVTLTRGFIEAIERQRDSAVYWLGLVLLDEGANQTAAQYFGPLTLEARPNGPWSAGARFNLARAHEARGELAEAIALYEADKSPQRYGNQVRAKRLKEKLKANSTDPQK